MNRMFCTSCEGAGEYQNIGAGPEFLACEVCNGTGLSDVVELDTHDEAAYWSHRCEQRETQLLEALQQLADKDAEIARLTADNLGWQIRDEGQSKATEYVERADCGKALRTLSGAHICTPAETYGRNTSWAISDLCRAVRELKSRAEAKLKESQT